MKLEKPINILVRRCAAIGDVIMSTGVVRELKNRYGDNANIDVATEFVEVYRNNPHIRNIWHTNAPPDLNQFDVHINLDDAYELNPTNHYVDNYFYRAFGTVELNRSVELFPSDNDRAMVDWDLQDIGNKFIVVHMRQWHWGAKNISMDVWFDIYAKIFEERTDFKVVCVGGSTDNTIEHPLFVDLRGKYNSQQLKYLCDHAACFVGIDSGPFACAAASSTHIVALLTHLHSSRILPYRNGIMGDNCTAIPTQEDCAGCNDTQQRPVRQLVCPKINFPCTSNFNTQKIADTILATLKETQ